MKHRIILIIGIVLFSLTGFSQYKVQDYLNQITIEDIQAHIDTLASEGMQGRLTGELGQKIAAEYIANEYSSYGLSPINLSNYNSYYQEFSISRYHLGESLIYYSNLQYPPIYIGSQSIHDSINDEILFAGYANDDDLKNLNLNNKSIFFFSESVKESIDKVKTISELNQINTFVIGIPFGGKFKNEIFETTINDLHNFNELFYYYNYDALYERNENDFNQFQNNNQVIPDFKVISEKDIRILFVPEELSIGIFLREMKDLKKLKRDELLNVRLARFSYKVNYNPVIETFYTENVIGYIDSELSDHSIIIGAHYDHVGINADSTINYGADDNASGTTAILEIAKALAQAKKDGVQLNKDIIFIAYTAEEIGLHGSEYYAQKPVFPLSKTNVVFNLDMIGRDMDDDPKNSNRVFLLDWKGGSKYLKNVNKLNKAYTKLIVDKSPGSENKTLWTYGSDHYSFAQRDISSIAYFTALHNDYHTPRDTPDKLNYDKLNRIIQLVFLNIWDLTYQEK